MEIFKKLAARAQEKVEDLRARYAFVDIPVSVFKRFSDDDGGSYAAALTYYVFFSIFPLLLFAVAIIGYVTFGNEELQEQIIASGLNGVPLIKDALTPDGIKIIQNNRGSLALTGVALSLYSGSGAVVALEHALNKISRVEEEPTFVGKRVRSLKWLAILGLGAVASLALSVVGEAAPGAAGAIIGWLGAFAVSLGMFMTAFKLLPATTLSWRQVLPGAATATVLFELLKLVGAAFLAQGEPTRNDTFGALAGAATLLVASYIVCQVILLSAEVNLVLAERRASRQSLSPAMELSREAS